MKLELERVRFETAGVRDARRVWAERESILLSWSEGRARAVGEAPPLRGYSRDELGRVAAALRGLSPAAVASALEHDSALAALTALSELLPSDLPSARMALETAALDWLGRRRGVPAPELLGAQPGTQRTLAALLGPAGAPTLFRDAERALEAGFRHLKLKLGEPGELDRELDALASLRQRLDPSIALRLDANGVLGAEELERAWPVLEPLRIELFEEPGTLPARLTGVLPLAPDESLQGLAPGAALELVQARAARWVVLKPTALGGLAHCLRLAELAHQAGSNVVVSHCFDGPFAFRAAAALALALPASAAHGLAPHPALAGWSTGPLPVHGAVLSAWSEPGLAASAGGSP